MKKYKPYDVLKTKKIKNIMSLYKDKFWIKLILFFKNNKPRQKAWFKFNFLIFYFIYDEIVLRYIFEG